ncbi:MAG: rod shape-determining protein RodA [Bacteroidetes bacterium]|nr:rod shape-determining protein RodA [Bacteroidota bacterium]MDA1119249.1 rod shape-determining protein RodA [Bacteroidota bacterium]
MKLQRQGQDLDWITILLYLSLIFLGWLNIYAAVYSEDVLHGIFDLSTDSGKQLVFIGVSFLIIIGILTLDFKFYDSFAYLIYGLFIGFLIAVLVFGKEIAGSKSWFQIAGFGFQPSEFAKFATVLALAKFLGEGNRKLNDLKNQIRAFVLFLVPMVLTMFQGDWGTATVYCVLIIVLYREGISPLYILIGLLGIAIVVMTLLINQTFLIISIIVIILLLISINPKNMKRAAVIVLAGLVGLGVVRSVDFIMTEVLKPHQQNRIMSMVNPNIDPLGIGWNVTQSKIAIGSGGIFGKGFLEGTQTKFDFVPAQSTDFIFCTVGEEQGWLGSIILIILFSSLILRVISVAERQKSRFARSYGYGAASIIFFHFMVNIGMTIGLFPVIGIPLPFFSYGGSSLISFTLLLFTLLKLDSHRTQVLERL